MSLKYYRDEAARYGSMGNLDAATMRDALEKACAHFGVPRVVLKFARTPRKFSWYRSGIQMMAPNLRLARAMSLPTIQMAPNHMIWQVFCHEFAHHVHFARFSDKVTKAAANAGVNVTATDAGSRYEFVMWARKNFRKEHAHGPSHRAIMQEVVDYFLSIGMITVLPTYKNQSLQNVVSVVSYLTAA